MIALNLLANVLGSAWSTLVGFIFVPVYLHYLGTEGYGLVGFFAMLTSFVAILDGSVSAVVSRVLAPLSETSCSDERTAALEVVRSFECVVWLMALVLSAVLVLASPWIAGHWLHLHAVDVATATQALRLMSIAFLMQWPCSLYSGCLIATQRQVALNAVNGGLLTLRFGGAALVLWLISPTLKAFFWWQVIVSLIGVSVLSTTVHRIISLGDSAVRPARFSWARLAGMGRFAGGVAGINVLALALGQMDKVMLSILLPLDRFGVYSLASSLASALYKLSAPIHNAVSPALFKRVAEGQESGTGVLFHKGCQLTALAIIPASVAMAFFSHEILLLWTRNMAIADQGHLALSALCIGTALNTMIWLPYALQLAYHWVRMTLYLNAISVLAMVPLVYCLTDLWGLAGGAVGWMILNIVYLQVSATLTMRRLLPGEAGRWYGRALAVPWLASGTASGLWYLVFLKSGSQPLAGMFCLSMAWLTSVGSALFFMPALRAELLMRIASVLRKTPVDG